MSSDESTDEAFPENMFYAQETWFLVRADAYDSTGGFLVGAILELQRANQHTELITFTPVFTDMDLAVRCMEQQIAQHRIGYRPVIIKSRDGLEDLLVKLINAGRALVAYDPGETRVTTYPTTDILDALRRSG
jgi:hypothetical protein